MGLVWGANAPTPPVSYCFIDGGSVSTTFERYVGSALPDHRPPVRWDVLRASHRKVFFYDAVPVKRQDEDETTYADRVRPKHEELRAIERLSGFHVRSGDVHDRRRSGRQQKMVDVQLAVDALLMASRQLFRAATIMTGDLDFKPLVTALVEMGVDVHLVYPPGETSQELIAAADSADAITRAEMFRWMNLEAVGLTLPTATSPLKRPGFEPGANVLTAWSEETHGYCGVARDGLLGDYRLLIERNPNGMPDTHSLELSCHNLDLLREFAQVNLGMTVPDI